MKKLFALGLCLALSNCGGGNSSENMPNPGENGGGGGFSGNSGSGGMITNDAALDNVNESAGGNGGSAGSFIDAGNDIESGEPPCAQDCSSVANYGTCACPLLSCYDIYNKTTLHTDGPYWIKPDGIQYGINVYCDMTSTISGCSGSGICNLRGSTLIYSSGSDPCTKEGTVLPGTSTYMPANIVQALAQSSTVVHIRTNGKATTESITSLHPNHPTPIQNLQNLVLVNTNFDLSDWTGQWMSHVVLTNSQPVVGNYPDIWETTGKEQYGMFITTDANGGGCASVWGASGPTEDIQVFVK